MYIISHLKTADRERLLILGTLFFMAWMKDKFLTPFTRRGITQHKAVKSILSLQSTGQSCIIYKIPLHSSLGSPLSAVWSLRDLRPKGVAWQPFDL
jgi:hypothetical protein